MRFWLFFLLGNAVLAWIPLLVSRLGHPKTSIRKHPRIWAPLYAVAVLGLTITRLASLELTGLVGGGIDGGGLLTFFGLTVVLPVILMTAVLWVLAERLTLVLQSH